MKYYIDTVSGWNNVRDENEDIYENTDAVTDEECRKAMDAAIERGELIDISLAWDAVSAAENSGYVLIGYRYTEDGLDALFERPDGNQETFVYNENGDAVDGENLGEKEFNGNYEYLEDITEDGYTLTQRAETMLPHFVG
jgi:hypothetical protein